ncbi:hypothetical protein F895_03632 [Acinetobacter sp. CIP 64.2]|uniref:hypothetical protein n=1 Tax=Acinetobacter TaxID=469 RepID=UPI0002888A8C|nr:MULTISPECIES: hypothetical protein [Acinetobacter]ENX12121.1 hypothetical protein F895_03632 [Acinetobacter sp. CIP 64.2]
MILDLGDTYRIVTDEYNFTLQLKKVIGSVKAVTKEPLEKNIGKIRYVDVGHYPSLRALINGLLRREILLSQVDSLKELESFLEECVSKILALLDPLVKKEPKSEMSK